jgi:hypothetical protein
VDHFAGETAGAVFAIAVTGILYLWSFMVTFLKMVTRQTAYINNFN